ncbi:MAG TPA: TetR/AcrR family transcriptional regulator [Solirubrobacterales bacterium]|nr:TetR/AcrR family transcriptional regulator [Solirubrobacterales bacterium]
MSSSLRIQLSQETLLTAIGDDWPPEQVEVALELLANSSGKFPSGVRKLPPDLVRAVQRERLIVAMLNAAAELGYLETNVQDVIDRAGVSRPTFYEHFSNKEDCFLAAFDTSAERLRKKVDAAVQKGGDVWRDRIRFGLEALLRFAGREPDTARTMVVEARAASAAAVRRRVELMDQFARCLQSEAEELLPGSPTQTPTTASGVVGGIESILYSRLCKQEHDRLTALLPSLMYFVVLPYEGHEAATEALTVNQLQSTKIGH